MKKFTFLISLVIAFANLNAQVVLLDFATGLTGITDIKNAGDDRIFVVEQQGRIKILDMNGTIAPGNFLNITNKVSSGGERGLLGLAFSPGYSVDGYFYVNYTNLSGNTVIARYSISTDPNKADSLSEQILLTVNQPASNHNGGHLAFGNDGYLYIGMGDGGLAGDPNDRSQNPMDLLGKMLRIDVSGGGTYSIPPDNPFVNNPAYQPEIWSLGVRNPWRFSFDKVTDDLWIADVGQGQWEEINFQPATSAGGENWGWRCYEGNNPFNLTGCSTSTFYDFPVHVYSHSGANSGCSVSGGYVYRGAEYPSIFGRYFYADYCSGLLGSIDVDNNCTGNFTNTYYGNVASFNPTTFGEDFYGNLYIGGATGIIKKIADTSVCQPVAFITCEDTLTICGTSVFLSTPMGNNFIYQWQMNGTPIPNSDSSALEVTQPGNYSVMVVNNQFCVNQSPNVYIDFATPPVVNFTGLDSTYCNDDGAVSLTGTPSGGIFSGSGISGNTFDPFISGSGTHTITYFFTDTATGCAENYSIDVTVYPVPAQPVITQNADTLFTNLTGNIQWLDSGQVVIPGETGIYLIPTYSGFYHVQYTDTNGCISISDPFLFVDMAVNELKANFSFDVFPNPASDIITINITGSNYFKKSLTITDQLGRVIKKEMLEVNRSEIKFKTSEWINGVYYLIISDDNSSVTKKIILMNN